MSVSHRYRNFGTEKNSDVSETDDRTEAVEDQKLQAFEAGYQAGWDDAIKAQADQKAKAAAELSQSLQEMSFTYHEALSKLTVSIEPIMGQIIDKLLPDLVAPSVGAHIVEQINALLKEQAAGPVEIVVHPDSVPVIEEMIETALAEPFTLTGDASLGAGQAFIRFSEAERQVDLDTVVKEVAKAMAGFFHDAAKRG